ncbi:MAG: hypothetical protein ABSE73_06270 [Planctomycetota bacterium]
MRRFLILFVVGVLPGLFCGCRKQGAAPQQELAAKEVQAVDPQSAPLVSGKRSKVYHLRDCTYAASIKDPVGFESVLEAEASGRIPCEFCRPSASNKKEQAPPPQGAEK